MSAWKLLVTELYRRGPLTSAQSSVSSLRPAVAFASRLGLIERPGRGGCVKRPYALTPLGVAYAEGRAAAVVQSGQISAKTGGRSHGAKLRMVATWLSSLPAANTVNLADRKREAA